MDGCIQQETKKLNNIKPLKGNVYILSTTDENFSPNILKNYCLSTAIVGLKYQSSTLQRCLGVGLYRRRTDGLPPRRAVLVHSRLVLTPHRHELRHQQRGRQCPLRWRA